ncbi:hypothetical protein BDR05DRAFT_971153, partial [Suillus weaverae]
MESNNRSTSNTPIQLVSGSSESKQLACDLLPPLTASSVYNNVFFAGAEEIFSVCPQCSLATSPVRQALPLAPHSQ